MLKGTSWLFLFLLSSPQDVAIDLTKDVSMFSADCIEVLSPAEEGQKTKKVKEFELLKVTSQPASLFLNFKAVGNCAQTNQGRILLIKDTLSIQNTDVFVSTEVSQSRDSLGNEIEVTTETRIQEETFCNCLIAYSYTFSRDLSIVRFLKFHERIFELKPSQQKN